MYGSSICITQQFKIITPLSAMYHNVNVNENLFLTNIHIVVTSWACGDTICLHPLQVDNIFALIRQVAPVPACWPFNISATS